MSRRSIPSFQVYLAARIFSTGAAFVVLKLLVGALTRDQYGDWGFLRTVGAVMVPLISLSLPASMQRFYFDEAESPHTGRSELVASVFWMSVGSAFLLASVGIFIGLAGAVSAATALFVGASVPAAIMIAFFDYLARTIENPVRYLQNRLVESGILIVGLLVFVNVDKSPSDGGERFGSLWWAVCLLAAGQWFVTILNLVQRAPELKSLGRPALSRTRMLELARFSAPLSGTFLVGWALSSSDVAVLRYRSEAGEVADYVLVVGVVAIAALVTQAALVDWPPFFYRAMADGGRVDTDRDLAVARRLQLLLGAHVAGLLGLRLFAPTAYRLLGADEFRAGLDLVGPLGLGNFFYLAGSLLAVGLGHAKRTHVTLIIFALPALLNLGLNWWFVPEYGASAAAWTTLASFVVFAILGWTLGARSYRFVQIPRVAALSALAVGVSLI